MPVLFLDFDGVLHRGFCHASNHFECELHLTTALEGMDIELVLSSTWRINRSLDELKGMLSKAVATRVIGVTPQYSQLLSIPSRHALYEREAECMAWLTANRPAWTRWLALDDRPWLFRPFSPNLFLVDGKQGLKEHSSALLRARLNKLSR